MTLNQVLLVGLVTLMCTSVAFASFRDKPFLQLLLEKNLRIHYEVNLKVNTTDLLDMTVSEFTRGDDLSMSIATDTKTEQQLELTYRNGSERNFRVDMISSGLKCKRDKKMRWHPTMLNGLFQFLQEEVLWDEREYYIENDGRHCIYWSHPFYSVSGYFSLDDVEAPVCKLWVFDRDFHYSYKNVVIQKHNVQEALLQPSTLCEALLDIKPNIDHILRGSVE